MIKITSVVIGALLFTATSVHADQWRCVADETTKTGDTYELGGDHTITANPGTRCFKEPTNCKIEMLDAHPDDPDDPVLDVSKASGSTIQNVSLQAISKHGYSFRLVGNCYGVTLDFGGLR